MEENHQEKTTLIKVYNELKEAAKKYSGHTKVVLNFETEKIIGKYINEK